VALLAITLVLAAFSAGRASVKDEAVLTVRVSSADHELQDGYFSLGDAATFMARPGTDLHRFLSRQRGHDIRITLTEAGRQLSRLDR
jgi:hypothetical protein